MFDELKRRNVIRVAIAYVVAAWVMLQAADLALDAFEAPEWVMKSLMLGLTALFPLVVGFSWAFEITPEGIKPEKDIDRSRTVILESAKKLDRLTIALLVVVAALVVYDRLSPDMDSATAVSDVAVIDKSIAVLAFKDLSADGDQAFFADGVAEEILNVLAQIPDLKVAGRTSSFAFRDKARDLREIGEILQVVHILEGSVRKSGDRVRITAQLVKADDGFHLFSKSYDRKLTDVFAVQDDIAREIGAVLRSTILGEQDVAVATPTDSVVYDNYLRARQWVHTRNRELMEAALPLLDEALAIDPDYAPALTQKAMAILLLSDSSGSYGDIPSDEANRLALPLINRALELDPNHADAHAVQGLWFMHERLLDDSSMVNSLRRALAINPALANANNWLAGALGDRGNHRESLRLLERTVEHDPLYGPAFSNLVIGYRQTHAMHKVDTLLRRVERMFGEGPTVYHARGIYALGEGRLADAFRAFEDALAANPGNSSIASYFSYVAMLLGEYERAASGANVSSRLMPLRRLGRQDEVAAELDTLSSRALSYDDFANLTYFYAVTADATGLLDFLERKFAGADDLVAVMPMPQQLDGVGLHADLAYLFRLAERNDEAERALAVAVDYHQRQLAAGANHENYWHASARLAAVQGDRERLVSRLRRALDTGHMNVRGFDAPVFNPYRNDSSFVALDDECKRLANAERAKLGLLAM